MPAAYPDTNLTFLTGYWRVPQVPIASATRAEA